MAATSKSPRNVLIVGHLIGSLTLAEYAHKHSPKTYTQPSVLLHGGVRDYSQCYSLAGQAAKDYFSDTGVLELRDPRPRRFQFHR